jgi:hypothetical protein
MDWDGAVNAWHVAGGVYRMGPREWLIPAELDADLSLCGAGVSR